MRKKIVVGIISIWMLYNLVALFYYLDFNRYATSLVRGRNDSTDSIAYQLLTHLDSLNLPPNKDIILYGEVESWGGQVEKMIVYPNAFLNQSFLLVDKSSSQSTSLYYWAASISNGTLAELWSSKTPLQEDDLHKYTGLEQFEQIEFLTLYTHPIKFLKYSWWNDTELIGYYNSAYRKFV